MNISSFVKYRTGIQFLEIQDFNIYDYTQAQEIVELINNNQNIKCLSLMNIFVQSDVEQQFHWKLSPTKNLKALILKSSLFMIPNTSALLTTLLTIYADKLFSLHLNIDSGYPDSGYSDLQELCVHNEKCIQSAMILSIIRNTPKLQRFNWYYECLSFNSQQKNIATQILQFSLFRNKNTEYISFLSVPFGYVAFQLLVKICTENRDEILQRPNLKIQWRLGEELIATQLQYVANNIQQLIHSLHNSVTDDFMFIFEIGNATKEDDALPRICKELEQLGHQKYIVNIHKIYRNVLRITISNRNNKMCGYHEQWMYGCSNCT